jgi:predicted nucleotidyltransferase
MVDRLELAKQYVQEMIEQRDDIVAAFVVGSVARGDADETSDIDLCLIVEGDGDQDAQPAGVAAWREGVYIEAWLEQKEMFADLHEIVSHRFSATYMNDALILYDRTGFLANVQEAVRAVFLELSCIGARVHPIVRSLREDVVGLKAGLAAGDLLRVCRHVRGLSFWLPSVPLLINGITPSSTRALIQLEGTSPELYERICEWQGSSGLEAEEVKALLPTVDECLCIGAASFTLDWGDLTRHFADKMAWMVDNGLERGAYSLLWWFVGGLAKYAWASDDAEMVSKTEKLVQDWMHAVGWEGQEVLEEKVRMAEEMVAEVEAMAAHLPSGEE